MKLRVFEGKKINKIDKHLARLRKRGNSTKIRNERRDIITDVTEITMIFRDYDE